MKSAFKNKIDGVMSIPIVIAIALFAGVVTAGYFTFSKSPIGGSDNRGVLLSGGLRSTPITVSGKISCLPSRGASNRTTECAIGLRGADGKYYGLKDLYKYDPQYKFFQVGLDVAVSGTFNSMGIMGPGSSPYDIAGTITVTSIKKESPINPNPPATAPPATSNASE